MRIALILLILSCLIGFALAGQNREFKIRTLEKLGNELSRRDEISAQAEDVVLATQPAAHAVKMRGWISELSSNGDKVHLIAETPSGFCLAYTVKFKNREKPEVEDHRGEPLPTAVATRFQARKNALAAVHDKLFADVAYNCEVLDDPDGRGFLVYVLAATKEKNEILTGGHYRVTVSADGSKIEHVDLLSQLIRQPRLNGDKETVAVSATQLSSNLPVETWLYSSHLYSLPMYVGCKDGSIWAVANGRIVRANKKGPKNHLDILNGKAPEIYPDEQKRKTKGSKLSN
jgi:hypothetical protein